MFVAGFVGRGASHSEGGSEWLHTVLEGSAQGMHSVLLGMRDPLIGEPSDGQSDSAQGIPAECLSNASDVRRVRTAQSCRRQTADLLLTRTRTKRLSAVAVVGCLYDSVV